FVAHVPCDEEVDVGMLGEAHQHGGLALVAAATRVVGHLFGYPQHRGACHAKSAAASASAVARSNAATSAAPPARSTAPGIDEGSAGGTRSRWRGRSVSAPVAGPTLIVGTP